jgi:hypothetical protein
MEDFTIEGITQGIPHSFTKGEDPGKALKRNSLRNGTERFIYLDEAAELIIIFMMSDNIQELRIGKR